MSTKTTIKRIALVAAVAAAFGGLSTVAANASATESAATLLSGSLVSSNSGSATAGTQVVGGIATVVLTETNTAGAAGDTLGNLTSTGVGSITSVAASTDVTTAATATFPTTSVAIVARTGSSASGETVTVSLASAVAGVQTVSFTPITANGAPGTAITATITWGAAAVVNVGYTAAESFISDGNTIPSILSQPGSSLSYPKTAGVALAAGVTTGATIGVNLFDGSNTAITGVPLTVTVSGPGLISLVTGSTTGTTGTVRAASLTATQMASTSHATIGVSADGTAGTSVITVATGSTTLFTKTVTFVGTVASIKIVSQNLFIAPATAAGGTLGSITSSDTGLTTGTTAAVELEALDANGNPVTGLTISGKSADTSVIASAGVAEETSAMAPATIGANGPGYYLANVVSAPVGTSGASTTVTFRTLLSDGVTYVTATPVTFSLGGAIAKEVLSTDASSYSSLAPVKVVLTATDSKGNPAYDQTVNAGLTSALVSSTQLGGAAFTATSFKTLNKGVSTLSGVYAPAVAGSFTISGTDTADVAGEAVSVTAASAGGSADASAQAATDAANEATDAANAATDAANAAADAADAATSAAQDASAQAQAALAAVNALSAKITVLAAQIAKIIKKLKA
jgi:hypothetical protein